MKRFWAEGRDESKSHQLARIGEKKIFHELEVHSLESRNQTFLGSGGRNESDSHQLARIGEKKIFDELDIHHVLKVGIKRFWAQEAEMSLTAISSLESAREKFFMNWTSCLESRNQKFFGSGGRNESNSHQLARIGERKIFHELDVHHV